MGGVKEWRRRELEITNSSEGIIRSNNSGLNTDETASRGEEEGEGLGVERRGEDGKVYAIQRVQKDKREIKQYARKRTSLLAHPLHLPHPAPHSSRPLQSVPGDSPEEHGESDDARSNENGDPDGTADQQLLDVRLSNPQRSKRRRFGLSKENQNRVELVLVGDQAKDGNGEGEEELLTFQVEPSAVNAEHTREKRYSRRIVSTLAARLGRSTRTRQQGRPRAR